MRLILTVLAATVGTALAHSHSHHRRVHVHEKKDVFQKEVEVTVLECWLEGHVISEKECTQGIANGTLRWAKDGSGRLYVAPAATTRITKLPNPPKPVVPPPAPVAPAVAPAPKPAVKPAPPPLGPPPPKPAPLVQKPAPPPVAVPVPPVPQVKPAVSAQSSGSSYDNYEAHGADDPFPDGQLDCSDFPSKYGAMRVPWLGLGGWSSVQKPHFFSPHGFSDIMTITRGQCQGDTCCIEGSYCSYACGEGLLKWQWPSLQGLEGQSVGGLLCRDGKLHLTNPNVPTLCAPGNDKVKVVVKNLLDQNVAICRTNYPGDEKMSIPLDVRPGGTRRLACPDSKKFWKTRSGLGTSAQYYINMPGYSVEKACVWGNPGDDFGNYAPANLGVGISDGIAYIGLFKNFPSQQNAVLPYTVTVEGGSMPCQYRNGLVCRGEGYSICESAGTAGCTVSATSGTVTFVLHN